MQKNDFFLCSQLVKLTVGRTVVVGNLEEICEGRCTVALEEPLALGTRVRMNCVTCPLEKKSCAECRFRGKVRYRENDPLLGCLMRIEFEGRTWSEVEWRPMHLTNVDPVAPTMVKLK
jgi:hypothetical protein